MPSAMCSASTRHSRAEAGMWTMVKSEQNIKKREARAGQLSQIRPGNANSKTVENLGIGVHSKAKPLSKE